MDELILVQRAEELHGEEGVPGCLRPEHRGERLRVVALAAEEIDHEIDEIPLSERAERGRRDGHPGALDLGEGNLEWVRGADLIAPVGAENEQAPRVGVREQVLEELEARAVSPLEVIQEEDERALLRREHAEEATEDEVEPVPRVGRPEGRRRGLLADDELDLRDDVDDELPAVAERGGELCADRGELRVGLCDGLPD